jgi:uncharacterized membrane protein
MDFIVTESEFEKASNSYLLSMVAFIVGVPLPITNLIATILYMVLNRNSSYFVRWHCTQVLLSQLVTFFINSSLFWWTIKIIFTEKQFTKEYFILLVFVLVFNLIELISTIYTAIKIREGKHLKWFIFGDLANRLTKK